MKTSALALAAALVIGSLVAPAFASDTPAFDDASLLTLLQQRGIDATAVHEDSDNVIRVTVQLADGGSTFAYYYEDTLQPIAKPAAPNTRVLSQLDVGRSNVVPATTESLLEDHFFD